ncbi:MAG TPA: hypothetical protein VH092_15185 [Urbifossiella sp.]|jgi:hypothetical protein|nr:hypothetical protein [Urbifossiella sp.]
MIVMLRKDPETGKQNIIVKLDSDPDALPIEHEQMHKTLVEKLVGKGIKAEDLGEIVIERESERAPAEPVANPEQPQRQKASTPG